jgi:hypothetical protein
MSGIKKYLTLIVKNRFDFNIVESILSDKLFFKYAIKMNGNKIIVKTG